ncbi:uncharacterized protein LOC124663589 [Lolium rigidum]|uniref:uncharacterized protein LOC124663589 n=1 Tax=Lolium rigidum TaxID=89674 RepID=UPI001F5CAB58|nr:uncharacterized protein LOC124663589 [Lolium rigidum]
MASWPQLSAKAAADGHRCDIDLDLKPRWDDGATTYLIRFDLSGFKKDEFKVLVDAGGRLTLRGQRPSGHVRVNKALQLPPTADFDKIAARFDGRMLCLTVPKLPVAEMALARMDEAKELTAWETEAEKERSEWDRGQVIAAAVAAFALGVVVTHKLLSAKHV